VLKDNIFLERELEGAKIEAALKPDFNLLDAFKIFDSRGAGNVSVQDVIMALRESIGFSEFTHDDAPSPNAAPTSVDTVTSAQSFRDARSYQRMLASKITNTWLSSSKERLSRLLL
jgi:hypothetical protein